MKSEFKYLPGIVPVVTFEAFFAVALVHVCVARYQRRRQTRDLNAEVPVNSEILDDEDTFTTAIYTFDCTFKNGIMRSKWGMRILCFFRLICFMYFLGVNVITNYLSGHAGWEYFTTWNLELITVYFLAALISSIIGCRYEGIDIEWSFATRCLGAFVHALFEVCGGTALLVTVVDFTLLDHQFDFWNVSGNSLSHTLKLFYVD